MASMVQVDAYLSCIDFRIWTKIQNNKTSSWEWTWALWVPFSCLAIRSWSFPSNETHRRRRFLLKRNITETPLRLK